MCRRMCGRRIPRRREEEELLMAAKRSHILGEERSLNFRNVELFQNRVARDTACFWSESDQ